MIEKKTKFSLTQETIVLADGLFPQHSIPLEKLNCGNSIVCCDGASMKLVAAGLEPNAIVGDLDSLPNEYKIKYADKLVQVPDQETNDLTKAVKFCLEHGVQKIAILGATGLREDHALANISLLAQYAEWLDVEIYTDTGYFTAVRKPNRFTSIAGQQISIFSLTPNSPISLINLKYPLTDAQLKSWWQGTLNEALGEWFELDFEEGIFIVFRLYA